MDFNFSRLPESLQLQFDSHYAKNTPGKTYLAVNAFHQGDARQRLTQIEPNSIALSVWSPPYYVGKEYEQYLDYNGWQSLITEVIKSHFAVLKPGGFLAINIADILCFQDAGMPRIQADAIGRKRVSVTREDILAALAANPTLSRYELASLFKCSEQTIDRRLNGNNIRGGKHGAQTRVKIVGGMLEKMALDAGLYIYDRRVWVKDAAWENSKWASFSYRSVDEYEYVYIFWKPGVTRFDRDRLTRDEWKRWGSRGVWNFPSVRSNDDHEAKFPVELPWRLIRLLSDPEDIILDCFMGSGTTAIAALRENRQFVGIELDPKYVRLAINNVIKEAVRVSERQA